MQHQNFTDKERGFTLIEMLAVIAIIGILTSIVIASYAPARERTAFRNAQSTMDTVRAAAGLCVFQNTNLNAPSPGARVCDTSQATWPNIAETSPGWGSISVGDNIVSDGNFSFSVVGPENTIICNKTRCTTN